MEPGDRTLDAPTRRDPSLEETQLSGDDPSRDASSSASHQSGAQADLGAGATLGRYVILSRLGAGAMGVVLAAYDPELDRKVALKLLKPQREEKSGARARLQREAQALAKLSHPNVVAVHDVGVHGDSVFVAMEFVDGQTLGAWTAERGRTWREVVAIFAEAGRGLVAAHEAGLVHRDFKPDNVMIDGRQRVRVMDFGLARARDPSEFSDEFDETARTHPDADSEDEVDPLATPLTRTGAMMGTPAYMSPEQFAGMDADARSNQFGFCVTAFEALHGTRPFAGNTLAALMLAVTEGRLTSARDPDVPAWLRRVIERGLATDPAERWPSMQALLDAMLDDPAARRRRIATGLGFASIAVAAGVAVGVTNTDAAPTCPDMRVHLTDVWDDRRKADVAQAFAAGELGFGDAALGRVNASLDAWSEGWVAARAEACTATRVRGEVSDALLDLKMACLDDRLREFGALVDVFAEADETVIRSAPAAAEGLRGLERCADTEALLAEHPPPEDPAVAAAVEALEVDLARAIALNASGKWKEGTEVVDVVFTAAQELGHVPFVMRVAAEGAWLHHKISDYERAVEMGELAFFGAEETEQTDVAADAARLLAYSLGYAQHKPEDGARWIRHAIALSKATGNSEAVSAALLTQGSLAFESGKLEQAKASFQASADAMEAGLGTEDRNYTSALNNLAMVANSLGEFDEAQALYERVVAIEGPKLGPDHPAIAKTHTNMGLVAYGKGDYDQARVHWEAALEIHLRGVGPDHPEVANVSNNLGALAYKKGDYPLAIERYERAIEIRRKHLGDDDPKVASGMMNLSQVLHLSGDTKGGLALALESTRIKEAALGAEDPALAFSYNTLGAMTASLGDFDAARRYHERAVALRETLGPDHPKLALSLTNLADVEHKVGNFDSADRLLRRALEIREAKLDADHPEVATTLLALARLDLDRGRGAKAVPMLERVVAIRDGKEPDATDRAWARFTLARALWERAGNGDRTRARELADDALTVLRANSGTKAERADEVQAWLDAHG